MKNRITITAASLALCLLASGGTGPAYASSSPMPPLSPRTGAGPQVETGEFEWNPDEGSRSVPMELKANVTVPLISVSLPADGFEFTVDPGNQFEISDPTAQITSPDVVIANHSVVPVRLEISSVAEIGEGDVAFAPKFPGSHGQSFQLVDTISQVGPSGTAILVLGRKGRTYATSRDFEQYAICPGRTGIPVAEIPAEEEAVLKLYGKVAPDFYGEYQFTVKPTLKISAVKAN